VSREFEFADIVASRDRSQFGPTFRFHDTTPQESPVHTSSDWELFRRGIRNGEAALVLDYNAHSAPFGVAQGIRGPILTSDESFLFSSTNLALPNAPSLLLVSAVVSRIASASAGASDCRRLLPAS